MIIASDIEGTLTTGATWKGLGSYLNAHGRSLAYNAYIVSRLPYTLLYYARIVPARRYGNTWLEGQLSLFRGMAADTFGKVADWVVENEWWPLRREDVIAEIDGYRSEGHRVVLTSGSYAPIVKRFAARMAVREVIATEVELGQGGLTGKIGAPFNTGEQKAANLQEYLSGAAPDVAYGDTLADAPMLALAGEAVVVHPDASLAAMAAVRGWRIVADV